LFIFNKDLCLLEARVMITSPEISKIKGIHPGVILKDELKIRGLKNNEFAELINEHKQTISAIINERRGVNPGISIKLSRHFGVTPDYFMQLQACYDVRRELEKQNSKKSSSISDINQHGFIENSDSNKLDLENLKSVIMHQISEKDNETALDEIITYFKSQMNFSSNPDKEIKISESQDQINLSFDSAPFTTSELSNQEIKIVKLICEEKTSQEIADILFVSKKTIESHRERILTKIKARNVVGVVMHALKHQLIKIT
jgi:addiction module HigA family antidote